MADIASYGAYVPLYRLARKDMGLALTLGKEIGVPLIVGAAVQQLMNTAVEAGYSEKSIQSVVLQLEEQAGVKVRTSG